NDANAQWCAVDGAGAFVRDNLDSSDEYAELLGEDIIPLAMHSLDLSVVSASTDNTSGLAQVSIQLGTNEVGSTEDGRCKPPTAAENNFDNCAVRQFDTIIRMTGSVKP